MFVRSRCESKDMYYYGVLARALEILEAILCLVVSSLPCHTLQFTLWTCCHLHPPAPLFQVTAKWLLDLEQFNEWMSEEDYMVDDEFDVSAMSATLVLLSFLLLLLLDFLR